VESVAAEGDKREKGGERRTSESEQEGQISVLPLESLKLAPRDRLKKIHSEMKFMHLNKSKSPSSPSHSRITNAVI
jgi:gluconate kinase